ncbi:MAG: hypothetical protein MJ099_00125 [Clostridia bacterium]|nr:hypothetical protein [Clostridia bacterium]
MLYEVMHEIQNSCGNNQKRDMTFTEVETDSPEQVVRQMLGNQIIDEITSETDKDGQLTFYVSCSGLRHRFFFSEA